MSWYNLTEDYKSYYGFIYKITHVQTGKYYIGRKYFWFKKTLPPLKGKRRKRRTLVESDWKTYFGSCKSLDKDITKYGEGAFHREILTYCKDKWECSYFELLEQIRLDVLHDKNSYNGIINVRLRGRKTA